MKSSLSPSPKSASHSRPKIHLTWIILGLIVGFLLWKIIQSDKAEMTTISAEDTVSMSRKRSLSAQEDQRKRKMRAEADPVSTYLDRAKRGMTDQEILSMIEDFEALGSIPTSGIIENLTEVGEKQNRWYSIAVEDVLSLNAEQLQMLRAALAEDLKRRIWVFEMNADPDTGLLPVMREAQFSTIHFFFTETLMPSKLCNLTSEQLKLTYHRAPKKRMVSKDVLPRELKGPYYLTQQLIALEPDTGVHLAYPPESVLDLMCSKRGAVAGVMDISPLFPVTPDQKLADHRDDFVAQARMLHPSQLRIFLCHFFDEISTHGSDAQGGACTLQVDFDFLMIFEKKYCHTNRSVYFRCPSLDNH
jgi:hypothetical protein